MAAELCFGEPEGVAVPLGLEQWRSLGTTARVLGWRLLGIVWAVHSRGRPGILDTKPLHFARSWESRLVSVPELRTSGGSVRTAESGVHLRSERQRDVRISEYVCAGRLLLCRSRYAAIVRDVTTRHAATV